MTEPTDDEILQGGSGSAVGNVSFDSPDSLPGYNVNQGVPGATVRPGEDEMPGTQLNTDADANMVSALNSDTTAMPSNILNNLSDSMTGFAEKFGAAPVDQQAPFGPPVNQWSADPIGQDFSQPVDQGPSDAEAEATDYFNSVANDAANQSVRAWSPLGGLNEPDPESGFGKLGYDPVTGSNLAQPGDEPIWSSPLGGINEPDPESGFGKLGYDPVTGSNLVQPGDPDMWSSPLGGIESAGVAAAAGSSSDAMSSRVWNLVV